MAIQFLNERKAVAIRFSSEESFIEALDILERVAPNHETILPGHNVIIMDRGDFPLIRSAAKLEGTYEVGEVIPREEVPTVKLIELRQKHFFGKS